MRVTLDITVELWSLRLPFSFVFRLFSVFALPGSPDFFSLPCRGILERSSESRLDLRCCACVFARPLWHLCSVMYSLDSIRVSTSPFQRKCGQATSFDIFYLPRLYYNHLKCFLLSMLTITLDRVHFFCFNYKIRRELKRTGKFSCVGRYFLPCSSFLLSSRFFFYFLFSV